MSLAAGCAKRSSPDASISPTMDGGDELAMLEQQLTQREAQLQAAGFRSRATRAVSGPARDGGDMSAEVRGAPPSTAPAEPVAPTMDSAGTSAAGMTGTASASKQAEAEDATPGGGRCQ